MPHTHYNITMGGTESTIRQECNYDVTAGLYECTLDESQIYFGHRDNVKDVDGKCDENTDLKVVDLESHVCLKKLDNVELEKR